MKYISVSKGKTDVQRSRWKEVAILTTVMLSLAACGSGSDGETSEGTDGDFSGQTLSFLAAQPQAGAAEILKTKFEEQTGATVEYTVVPYDQIQATATLDAQSGAGEYDVFQFWYTSVGALAANGALVDLTDLIDSSESLQPDDYLSEIYEPYTMYEESRYGIPFDGDYHMLFYNEEILDQAGVEVPTTWEEFEEATATITEQLSGEGIYGTALLGRNTAFDIGSSFFNRLSTSGGKPFAEDGSPNMDSPEAIAAATQMNDVAPHALPTPLETGFDTALTQWLAGNIGMMEAWTDLGAFSQDPEGSEVVDKWGVTALPVGESGEPGSALNAGWAFGISSAAPNAELAQAFIEFAGSQELNLELSTTTGSGVDPIYLSTLESEKYAEFVPQVQEAAVNVTGNLLSWPTRPESPELITILNDELSLMLQGNKTPEEAMQAVQSGWTDALG